MCVCVKSRSPEPARRQSAEGEGDVELLVGEPPWRFTAQSKVLATASPVFNAQFNGPMADKNRTQIVPDVDPRGFEVLLRYVGRKPLELRSEATALSTMYAAHKYLLPGLVKHCTEYLQTGLQPHTVLEVYSHARQYCPVHQGTPRGSPGRQPSAPPESDLPPEPPGVAGWSAVLLTRCLDYIDLHGEDVLAQEELADLPRDALQEILRRDTLCCSEMSILHALQRWAERECRRQQLPLTSSNHRHVLGDLLFLIRLPLLTAEEFIRGPLQSELLSAEETKFFSALVTGATPPSVPRGVKHHLSRMLTPRSSQTGKPEPSDLKRCDTPRKSKCWQRSKTSKEKEKEKEDRPQKARRCSGSCLADSLIDVLVCIFD